MHNFFITGLPRTRTSWLANFLTHGNSFCFHELSNRSPNYLGIKDILMNRKEEYVGVADCALPFYYEPLADSIHDQRLVIIHRDKVDVYRSLLKMMEGRNLNEKSLWDVIEKTEKKIKEISERYEHLAFDFDQLNDRKVIEEIWYYCIPGISFDEERFNLLDPLQIEPEVDKWFKNLNVKNIQSIMEG